jgi:hypothetical protein
MLMILIFLVVAPIAAHCLDEDYQAAKARAPYTKAFRGRQAQLHLAQLRRRLEQPHQSLFAMRKPIAVTAILFFSGLTAIGLLGVLGCIK